MRWVVEAETRDLSNAELGKWLESRKAWITKGNEKGSILRQKACVRWDVEGDENSKFFHAFMKRRCNKNTIQSLLIDGVWCEDPVKIKNEIFKYYKDDTIIFGEWSRENACNLINVLKCFEEAARLKINFKKSKVYGVGVEAIEALLGKNGGGGLGLKVMLCGVKSLKVTMILMEGGGGDVGSRISGKGVWTDIIRVGKVLDGFEEGGEVVGSMVYGYGIGSGLDPYGVDQRESLRN
ncbi:hypothetical protein Tco_0938065 [Tanacetum coccineum]|uniref:Reverse transcriptase domain-containing protein n=1 Tax=Tanacetum coccineum TaxID=301880 RepID=A0ABQ5DGQ4_9ASTR